MDEEYLDKIIKKLHNPSANHAFSEDCLFMVAQAARAVFLSQPMLLELAAPVSICGDIHGQYLDLIHLFDLKGAPPLTNYLFLGDYVDRGNQSLECIVLLLCYKIKYPANFFLLRGNHESSSLNRIYGFYDECKRRYSVKLWKIFSSCFNCMPIAAVVGGKIFCMHGGLSPELNHLADILTIARPIEVPDEGLMCDLLWADPGNHFGWEENVRYVESTCSSTGDTFCYRLLACLLQPIRYGLCLYYAILYRTVLYCTVEVFLIPSAKMWWTSSCVIMTWI